MSQFIPDEARFLESMDGRVVCLSGGATGIGQATVRRLFALRARVVFGDVKIKEAEGLVEELRSSSTSGGEVEFVHCDVTRYEDIYRLFRSAYDKYGRVDHAISCAGILEQGNWFDPELTVEAVGRERATTAVIDVNVIGSANFARIAVVFLRDKMRKEEQDKSLTLLSSVNAFRESPGLYMYQTSKHAIQGLMRAMRKPIFERDRIRVNCICPGMTETPMTAGIVDTFKQDGYFWQTADDVAKMILGVETSAGMNGKAIYVEGATGWEFEDSFYRTQPQWLGDEPTRMMRANAEAVNRGALLRK